MFEINYVSDVFNQLLLERRELLEIYEANFTFKKGLDNNIDINKIVMDFLKDFGLIDDLKEYIIMCLETFYKKGV